MVGLTLKDRRDVERAEELVSMTMAFLELDYDFDKAKTRVIKSPTSADFFKQGTILLMARNEARGELLAYIRKYYPHAKLKR
jgi:hypothetical protein